jgi:hypothetical protein
MQGTIPEAPRTLYDLLTSPALVGIVGFLFGTSGVLAWLKWWPSRKQPLAEIQESESRKILNISQARKLELDGNLSAGDIVLKMMDQMRQAQSNLNEMAAKQRELEDKLNSCEETEARCKLLDMQLQRASAILAAHNLTAEFSKMIEHLDAT